MAIATQPRQWLPAGSWAALDAPFHQIPDGGPIVVAVDVAVDFTEGAIAWAHRFDSGYELPYWSPDVSIAHARGELVHVDAYLLSERAPDHAHFRRFRLEYVEEIIATLARRYRVEEVLYEPGYFDSSAASLSRLLRLFLSPTLDDPSGDACRAFYGAVVDRRITHRLNGPLSACMEDVAAIRDERGWRLQNGRAGASLSVTAARAAIQAHSIVTPTAGGCP